MSAGDAPFILRLLNEPSFIENIADRGIRSLDDARAYILNGPVASYAQHGFGLYCVDKNEDSTSVGICGLLRRDSLRAVDIGFALLPEYWSQGFASEAARAVLNYGRKTLALPEIIAITSVGNEPSARVLEKLGMTVEGPVQLSEDGDDVLLFS